MNCPNCGAAMRLDEQRACWSCDYCSTLHFPEPNEDGVRVLGEASGERCPVCGIPLVRGAIEQQQFLYCQHCRGMLVPMGGFMALVEQLRLLGREPAPRAPRPTDAELRREIRCPLCHEVMDTHPYAGPGNVVIDNCPRCTVNWLDHTELTRIVTAPDESPNPEEWRAP